MALSTLALGLLPNYNTIGVWAPLLLLIVRSLQGFSCGGELIGSIVFVIEHAPRAKHGFYSGFGMIGTTSGLLLAPLVVWFMYLCFNDVAVLH